MVGLAWQHGDLSECSEEVGVWLTRTLHFLNPVESTWGYLSN